MRIRRLALLAAAALTLALAGCFGPVERPVADFTWCPDGSVGALDYQFTSTSTTVPGQWIEMLRWEFDDGTPPEMATWSAWHRFTEEGTYSVTLTVTDSRGISGTVTHDVPVTMAVEIFPNWQLTLGWPMRVTGTVANRAAVKLTTAVIKAKFYDTDGVRISDGTVTLEDLDPGEMVAFTIEASEPSARIFHATVEVDSFTADCPDLWLYPVAGPEGE